MTIRRSLGWMDRRSLPDGEGEEVRVTGSFTDAVGAVRLSL